MSENNTSDKKAVFLDRDGVINEVLSERVKFVNKPEDLYLLPGVGKAIKRLNETNFEVFVVTNQGGVGLGYMTEKALAKVHDHMLHELQKDGASITEIAYCPHKPHANCLCRKPKGKLIRDLAKKYDIDLEKSFMVGDRDVDILAGKDAGVRTVLLGEGDFSADAMFPTLTEAVDWIIQQEK